MVFVGERFVFGLLGDSRMLNLEKLKNLLRERNSEADVKVARELKYQDPKTKEKIQVRDVVQLFYRSSWFERRGQGIWEIYKFFDENRFVLIKT